MSLSADLGIDYTNKRIYATGTMGSTFYSVRDLYSYLMGVFASTAQLDDTVPMSAQTPFDYTMINGWYMEQGLAQNWRGGSIKTSGYNGAIQLVKFGATYTSAISSDIGKTVTIGGFTGVLLDYNNTKKYWWIRSTQTAANSTAATIASGTGAGTTVASAACITGEELFSNIYTLGTVANGNMYVLQGSAVLSSWWGVGNADGLGGLSGNHIDVLIKVTEAGVSISSGSVTVFCRNYGDTYDHSTIDLSSGGRNPVALATATDINNTTAEATIAHYVAAGLGGDHTIASSTVAFGTTNIDVDDDGTAEAYDAVIDPVSVSLAIMYEVVKWLTAKGRTSATQINGSDGRIYISANGSYSPVKASPFGTFAGGKFFGARGIAFTLVDIPAPDASNYQTIDAAGNARIPPVSVTVAVNGVVSGDEVAVLKTTSGVIVDVAMFTSHASANASGNGTFVQQEAIPNDTPATGFLRVRQGTLEDRYAYTSYNRSTKTYTLTGTLARTYTGSDKAYVPYIDDAAGGTSISKSIKYVADRTIVARVRNGAGVNKIVPFEVGSSITSTGLSIPASRVADAINTN